MQAPFPGIKASNSWHKESWLPLGGAAGLLAVVAVQRSDGLVLVLGAGTVGISLDMATLEGAAWGSGLGLRRDYSENSFFFF